MGAEDGLFQLLFKGADVLTPGPRVRAMWRGTLDVVFPPQALDGGAALAGGLSAEAWSRIQFLDGPVCDGCGQEGLLLTKLWVRRAQGKGERKLG
jgi:hypothetical protein